MRPHMLPAIARLSPELPCDIAQSLLNRRGSHAEYCKRLQIRMAMRNHALPRALGVCKTTNAKIIHYQTS